jgi:DNA-binding response OmpR family regulator
MWNGGTRVVKQRVLIVDDEALLARTLSLAFRESGFEVSTAGSAEQATEIVAGEESFDLMILDNRLPGRSGLDFLQSIGAHPDTRVVLMTAYDTEDTYRRSVGLGVDLYLRKPFDLNALLSQASALLEKGAKA